MVIEHYEPEGEKVVHVTPGNRAVLCIATHGEAYAEDICDAMNAWLYRYRHRAMPEAEMEKENNERHEKEALKRESAPPEAAQTETGQNENSASASEKEVRSLIERLRKHVAQDELKGVTHGLCYWCIEVIEGLEAQIEKEREAVRKVAQEIQQAGYTSQQEWAVRLREAVK